MPTFLRYRKPTSRRAWRSSSRNWGLVDGSFAWERSRIGIALNDIANAKRRKYEEGNLNIRNYDKG